MKNKFALLIVIATMTGCSKNEPVIDNASTNCKLINYSDDDGVSQLKYDQSGNVIEYIIQTNNSKIIYKYSYTKANIIVKKTDTDNYSTTTEEYTYKLDNNNRIIEESGESGYLIKYSYTNEGYLNSMTFNNEVFEKFEYSNGNIKTIEHIGYSETSSFEYDLTKPNTPFINSHFLILGENFDYQEYPLYEKGFFGKISKNRIIKDTRKYGRESSVYNLTYQEDTKSNVINITHSLGDNKSIVTRTFDCQ